MKLPAFSLFVLSAVTLPFLVTTASADSLGTASSFAVLGEAGVTNAGVAVLGNTLITGDLGGSTGTPSVTGFPPGIVTGTLYNAGAPGQAFLDVTSEYNFLSGLHVDATLSSNLTGLTLAPGVYSVPAGSTNLAGVLHLDDHGVAGSTFVFLMTSSLITDPNSSIDVSKLHANDRLFWVVGSAATLGVNTDFIGNILAHDKIAFAPGATDLCGRALSRTASVTFAGQSTGTTTPEQNQVSISCSDVVFSTTGGPGSGPGNGLGGPPSGVPEPSTLALLLAAGLLSMVSKRLLLS
jgi:hypothetical protein